MCAFPRIVICCSVLLLVLVLQWTPFMRVQASNYDAYLDLVHQRNRRLSEAFGSDLDNDWHHAVSNNLYDADGYLRGDDVDAEEAWQRIQRSISDYRERNKKAMQDYHKRLPQLLQDEPQEYLGTTEEDAKQFYSLVYPDINARSSTRSDIGEDGGERSDRNEVPFENDLWGEHRVSGGNGRPEKFPSTTSSGGDKPTDNKGQSNSFAKPQEVKTDRLPGYCDPPNPCPIGMDLSKAPAPCDSNIENTKAFNRNWNWVKMQNGECTCDREHMNSCPTATSGNGYDRHLNHRSSSLNQQYEHQSIKKKAGPKMFNLVDM